ncbi:MAG TPA: DNA polymerase III subunit delta' [Candidatus Binatia bacterium]
MSFAEITGHTKQLAMLRTALSVERLHHAYLFVGPEGIGKRSIAIAVAKAIHCEEGINDFCGSCVNCARITDGNHPDVRLVQPLPEKKEISIQQIRDLERDLHYRSFGGKRKIALIDPATLMNLPAQNALLKTLEEPPDNSWIVLISSNSGGLLPTVRSRCVRLSFAPLKRQQVAACLVSQNMTMPDETESLAAMSMGSIGLALKLKKEQLFEKRKDWANTLSSLKSGDYHSAMAAAEELGEDRDETMSFLGWVESWFRDLLVYQATGEADELVNVDMLAEIERQSARISIDRLHLSMDKAISAGAAIQRNFNRRMILEDLLFSVVRAP